MLQTIIQSLQIDGHLVLTQLVGFLILIWLLNRYLFKPIIGILDERQANIKATYDQLDADRDAMANVRREYEQLAQIEAEAREKIQEAVKEAQALRESIVADARHEAEAIVERGRAESERERQKAFLEMRGDIVSLALGAAGRVLGETLDNTRHTKLVDDFIANIGASGGSTGPSREASA